MKVESEKFYGVSGDTIKGPYIEFDEAKTAIGVAGAMYTDMQGGVYRYGSKFIGRGRLLQGAKILPQDASDAGKRVVKVTTTTTLIFADGSKRVLPTLDHYLNETVVLV